MMFVDSIVIILVFVIGFYFYALVIKDNSIMDIGWGMGFVILSFYNYMMYSDFSVRQTLLMFLIFLWGIRLTSYQLLRYQGENARYLKWRRDWKFFYLRSFFQLFLFQGLLIYFISLPIFYVNSMSNYGFEALDFWGLMVFVLGFGIEIVADYQLFAFVSKKKTKVVRFIKSGLWRYSRHPNYFGEAILWWGLFLIAYSGTGIWWLVISPIVVTSLLRFFAGIRILEERFLKDPEYRKYAKQTNVFVPWRVRW